MLRDESLDGFELGVEGYAGKLVYIGELSQSPSELKLSAQIQSVLDMHYPEKITFVGGASYGVNDNVAQSIARLLTEWRGRDRKDIECQLLAIIKAFKSVG